MATIPSPAAACVLFWAGHRTHWVQWRRSLDDQEGLRGRVVRLEGELIRVALRDGRDRSYRHHNPAWLAELVARTGPAVWVSERWSLLRIGGGHCLSITRDTGTPLADCLPLPRPDTASPRVRGTHPTSEPLLGSQP